MAAMEPILAHTIPSTASAARGSAEQGEKAGSPDTTHTGEHRFGDILKSTAAGQENPAKDRPSAQGGRRTAIAGMKAEADTSTHPSVSAAVGGVVAPAVPNDSLPAAGGAASEPNGADPAEGDPVPSLVGAATLAAEGDPLLKQIISGMHPATADGEESAAPVHAPKAADPGTVPAPPTAAASEPKNAGFARVDGTPACYGNIDPAPEGAQNADGTRKRKDDASVRNGAQSEPTATSPADGIRGMAERPAAFRPVSPAPDPGVVRFEEKAFVITRKSDTSVEVTLAPPGVGKLEIEVVLEKGVVNARIVAADSTGREAIARSLPQIVEALARDGMNVGGFTVSLKERRDRTENAPGHGASRDPEARLLSAVTQASSASAASAGLVDIFV